MSLYVVTLGGLDCVVRLDEKEAKYIENHVGEKVVCENCSYNNPCAVCSRTTGMEVDSIELLTEPAEVNRDIYERVAELLHREAWQRGREDERGVPYESEEEEASDASDEDERKEEIKKQTTGAVLGSHPTE